VVKPFADEEAYLGFECLPSAQLITKVFSTSSCQEQSSNFTATLSFTPTTTCYNMTSQSQTNSWYTTSSCFDGKIVDTTTFSIDGTSISPTGANSTSPVQ
jgi:hypothetical protein